MKIFSAVTASVLATVIACAAPGTPLLAQSTPGQVTLGAG